MLRKVFLYPQTIFYPPTLLKAADFIEECWILELLHTKERVEKYSSTLQSKTRYLNLFDRLKVDKTQVENSRKELYHFANELRDLENLKLFQLHQKLFEESFDLKFTKEVPEDKTLASLLRLVLAEDMDTYLLEVSQALDKFSIDWKTLIREKILYEEEDLDEEILEGRKEELWDWEKRVNALKKLFQLFFWKEEELVIRSLLISEERILEEILENFSLLETQNLSKEISLYIFKEPINSWLGMPLGDRAPQIQEILLVSSIEMSSF